MLQHPWDQPSAAVFLLPSKPSSASPVRAPPPPPAPASPVVSRQSNMDILPNELLLAIFENLTYFDLKRTRLVNKRFYHLLDHRSKSKYGALDNILFPDVPVHKPPATNTSDDDDVKYRIHPVFQYIRYDVLSVTSVKEMGLYRRYRCRHSPRHRCHHEGLISRSMLLDISACEENATSPATSELVLVSGRMQPGKISRKDGRAITVRNVMESVVAQFERESKPKIGNRYGTEGGAYMPMVIRPPREVIDLANGIAAWRGVDCLGVGRVSGVQHIYCFGAVAWESVE